MTMADQVPTIHRMARTSLQSHSELPEDIEVQNVAERGRNRIHCSSQHVNSRTLLNRQSEAVSEHDDNMYQMTSTINEAVPQEVEEHELHHVNLNLFFESVKAIYRNRVVDYEALLRKVEKQNKFVIKVDHLVRETEGTHRELSLADLWRWIKGLLEDFLKVRDDCRASQQML